MSTSSLMATTIFTHLIRFLFSSCDAKATILLPTLCYWYSDDDDDDDDDDDTNRPSTFEGIEGETDQERAGMYANSADFDATSTKLLTDIHGGT